MGGVLAGAVDAGHQAVVVTATRGEAGEIHNRDDAEQVRDRLGEIRTGELAAALRVLGLGEPAFLGYRDSGMMGTPENARRDAFWHADLTEAVGRLVAVVRRHRPDVITAYDPFGGYGHPDHIQVHRVGTAAYWAAADVGRYPADEFGEPWKPSKLYWATWSRERMVRVRRALSPDLGGDDEPTEPAAGTQEHLITTSIDVAKWLDCKREALLCHDTQFPADSWARVLSRESLAAFLGVESFTLVHSTVECDPADPDLFSGV